MIGKKGFMENKVVVIILLLLLGVVLWIVIRKVITRAF